MLAVLKSSELGEDLANLNSAQIEAVVNIVPKHLRYGRSLIEGVPTEGKSPAELLALTQPDIRRRQGHYRPRSPLADTKYQAHWLARWFAATILDRKLLQKRPLKAIQRWVWPLQ
jgi:hypothetical protein